jgi:eukaryotic-like serine/threonine-protein kinase
MLTDEAGLVEQIGRYTVVRLIGQGAMGRVLLANDPVLDRQVAIKILRDDLGLPAEHLHTLYERMRQEARASARISHPNLVALFDMGEDLRVGLFLVFEFVEGITLKQRIAQGPLGADMVRRLALELGSALADAHEARVLHRDIKPDNVILARTGAKIADFGIARVPDSTLTRDGRLLGTPAYSAPEAISHGTFSSASDQFSLATTLYEALCLHRAFPGDDAVAVAARITYEEPPPIAALCGLDARVDTVFARALSKNPKARFDSCEHFAQTLAEALTLPGRRSAPTMSEIEEAATPPPMRSPRNTQVTLFAAIVGGLLALALAHIVRNVKLAPAEEALDAGLPTVQISRRSNETSHHSAQRPRTNARSSGPAAAAPMAPPREPSPSSSAKVLDAGSAVDSEQTSQQMN